MKKLLFVLLALPTLANAQNADFTEINGLYFDLFDYYGTGTCRFTSDFGASNMQSVYTGDIIIPSTVIRNENTYSVTTLGANVFYNTTVHSVAIPSTITAIEDCQGSNVHYINCYVENPDQIKNNPSSNGKTISTSNGNLYNISNFADDCIMVVPFNTKSKYTANGWETAIKGGIYENAWFKANNKTRFYGDTNPIWTFSYIVQEPILTDPTLSCSATQTSPVGDYQISFNNKVGVVESGIATFIDGQLRISKAPLTITANNYTIFQGDPLPTFECTYDGFKNGETESVLTTMPTISCSATSNSAPGTYDIIVQNAAATNYSFTYVKGTLTIKEKTVSYTLNATRKGTFCSEYDLDFTNVSNIKAYIISGFKPSTGQLVKTRVYNVPAGTGLYIDGTDGTAGETYNIPIETTNYYYSNMLKGITVASYVPTYEDGYTNYILMANGSGDVWFVKSDGTGQLVANRAYVQIPSSLAQGRRRLGITDDNTTGIDNVRTFDVEEPEIFYYNLNGQKIQNLKKGIYISNGKKIIIR